MAEMTAAEALGILGGSEKQPQSEQELITSIIAGITRGEKCFVLLWDSERVQVAALIEQQAQEIDHAKATIDTHSELIEHYKQRAEQAEKECKRLRVCGNCRHFSTGYTGDYCVNANNRETMRQNTCRDWEMV